MNISRLIPHLLMMLICCTCNNQDSKEKNNSVKVFPLSDVTLSDGPFKHATELNKKILLNYEPDRLLARFRKEAGLPMKAEPYMGWEAQSIAGHSLGHYLSACALMYQSTGEEEFLNRARYIVDELALCQQADGDGYIGAFRNGKKILEEEVAKGNIRSQGFDLNGIWVPYYTQHKVMAGLRDAYRLCGLEKALDVSKNFADWLYTIVSPLNDDQLQLMLNCEHGGTIEVLVDLYADTGNEKYLEMSYLFHHKVVLDSLAKGKDILPNIHGNTQIPKLIGLARRYELTKDENDYKAATFFWGRVVNHHSYVTGGHGNHEYFGEPDKLRNRLSQNTTETCNVYNMLKLSGHLFQWEPRADVADYIERALFNQILSSQHPESGRVIYNLSLEMGGRKVYQNPEWFTCCVGSGMENHAKYGEHIFYHNKNEFYVSQFIAAEVNWKEKDMRIRQQTNFPNEQSTTILIEAIKPQALTFYIRYPYWAAQGINIEVNGQQVKFNQQKSSFISIKRVWKNGDRIDVSIPFTLRLETMPDDKNRVAVMHGPLVLAGELGEVNDTRAYEPDFVPVLFTEVREPAYWLEPEENPNTFKTKDGVAKPRGFTLKPFYATHDVRYSVYWDIFNEAEWEAHQLAYQAELEAKKKLEAATYDFFQPGEMQPERDHNFQGDSVNMITHQNRKAREANRGGWLSFEMKINREKPMALVIEYWGGFTGSKTFDILVNGEKIATENISGKQDGAFIQQQYNLPASLIGGSDIIKVKFSPHVGHRAGPFFGARTIALE